MNKDGVTVTGRASVFTEAAKPGVLLGIKVYYLSTEYWDFFRRSFFGGQRNVTILKMLISPEVSKKDAKIGIILCATMRVFDEN